MRMLSRAGATCGAFAMAFSFMAVWFIRCAGATGYDKSPSKNRHFSSIPLAFGLARREALQKASSAVVGGLTFLSNPPPTFAEDQTDVVKPLAATSTPSLRPFTAYGITSDPSEALNPTLESIEQKSLLSVLASSDKGGTIWLGEHHNSERDHLIQAEIIRRLHETRAPELPMSIGLEQVQVQFQPVLDDYVNGEISLVEMRERVQWDTRWTWPFENYRPIFELAKELNIQLVALNVDSEDLALVEKDGYPGLDSSQLQKYIKDPYGFAEFAKPVQFRTYVDYVIRPSYDLHKAMGLLQKTISGQKLDEDMPFRNFFSARALWDESMASGAYSWTQSNPGGLMIGLVGADHVKFTNGIPGRYMRMAGDSRDCFSVMLNPTLIDTRPPGTVSYIDGADSSQYPDRITLQLRYVKDGVDIASPSPLNTGGVLPLADYIIIS